VRKIKELFASLHPKIDFTKFSWFVNHLNLLGWLGILPNNLAQFSLFLAQKYLMIGDFKDESVF